MGPSYTARRTLSSHQLSVTQTFCKTTNGSLPSPSFDVRHIAHGIAHAGTNKLRTALALTPRVSHNPIDNRRFLTSAHPDSSKQPHNRSLRHVRLLQNRRATRPIVNASPGTPLLVCGSWLQGEKIASKYTKRIVFSGVTRR